MAQPRFRLQGKNILLTYPQCNLEVKHVCDELALRLPPGRCSGVLERHQDGNPHLHILWELRRRLDTQNPRFFDVDTFHPNVVVVRSVRGARDYIAKTGAEVYTNEPGEPECESWGEILEQATSREGFLDLVRKHKPRDFILNMERLEYAANILFAEPEQSFVSMYTTFAPPSACHDWWLQYGARPRLEGRLQSLYVEGASRIGKTEWARSLGPHVYFNNMYNLDDLKSALRYAEFAVFDDIPFDRLPAWKSFFGCQHTFTLTDRYRKKFTISDWSKPSIFLVNPDMTYDAWNKGREWEYIKQNAVIVKTDSRFY
ncbi:Rep [Baminivirus]|uniref:Rep n=1 Tax=Baminivirus TaxID=1229324 RepID=UPI00027EDBC8|nr:Rep [Baminivirus]AFR11828.1 Rep [Baminivirus]